MTALRPNPQGWKPHSIKVNGAYISYEGTPLAFLLGALGNVMDRERYGRGRAIDDVERLTSVLAAAPGPLMDSGVMSGLNTVFKAIKGEGDIKSIATRPLAGFIPAQSMMRDLATALDPQQVDTNASRRCSPRTYPSSGAGSSRC
jgi:hypothetical protein